VVSDLEPYGVCSTGSPAITLRHHSAMSPPCMGGSVAMPSRYASLIDLGAIDLSIDGHTNYRVIHLITKPCRIPISTVDPRAWLVGVRYATLNCIRAVSRSVRSLASSGPCPISRFTPTLSNQSRHRVLPPFD
jgi:hypothetical protein